MKSKGRIGQNTPPSLVIAALSSIYSVPGIREKVWPTLTPGDHKRSTFVLQKRPKTVRVAPEPLRPRERQSAAQDAEHRTQIRKITGQRVKGC